MAHATMPQTAAITVPVDPRVDAVCRRLRGDQPHEYLLVRGCLVALQDIGTPITVENVLLAVLRAATPLGGVDPLDRALDRRYDIRRGLPPMELVGRVRRILDEFDAQPDADSLWLEAAR